MATSLRQAATCIGLRLPLSTTRDFFGITAQPVALSLGTQLRRLSNRHVHFNIIRVGSDQFTAADETEIDAAVQFTRDTYAAANIGVGRIEHYGIPTAEADGRDVINSDSEAETLTDEWTLPNHALDIFFVRMYVSNTIGLSRVGGSCDKDAKGMDGSVVEMNTGGGVSTWGLAHEACHYLGNGHRNNTNALMNPSVPLQNQINSTEAGRMSDHCFTRPGC
jgi:hypothetical protein